MKSVFEKTLAPKTGLALEVRQGQRLRVIEIEGKQVVDLVAWNLDNLREKTSTAYSRNRYFPDGPGDYFPHDTVKEGDWLMSNVCRPMLTIVKETAEPKGVHGSNHRMCNRFFYKVFGGEERDGCFEIIAAAISGHGLLPEDIPDSFDLFMNYPHDCEKGHFTILEPITNAGDYIEFGAEMNLLVAMSNCPEDLVSACNAGRCKPVGVEVYEDPEYELHPVLSPSEWLASEVERRAQHG